MTPQEFLESLQSVYSYDQYMYLVEYLQDLFGPINESEDIWQTLKGTNDTSYNEYVTSNFDILVHNFPSDIAAILSNKDYLAVGALRTADFNGSAIPVPSSNAWVIVLQSGISELIYETMRIVIATQSIQWAGSDSGPETATIEFDEAAKLLGERFSYYITTGVAFGADSKASPDHIKLASFLTTIAERFVLCHESAHILLGHNRLDRLCALPVDWNDVSEAVHAREAEFEADELGFRLLLSSLSSVGMSVPPIYAGASLFLQVAGLVEELARNEASPTHPPAMERLTRLRTVFRQECLDAGQDLEYFTNFERGLSKTLEEMTRRILNIYQYNYSPVLDLIHECARTTPPNYMRFYLQFFRLLAIGAPPKLCRTIGEARAIAEHYLEQFDKDGNAELTYKSVDEQKRFGDTPNVWKFTAVVPKLYAGDDINNRIEYYYNIKKRELEAVS